MSRLQTRRPRQCASLSESVDRIRTVDALVLERRRVSLRPPVYHSPSQRFIDIPNTSQGTTVLICKHAEQCVGQARVGQWVSVGMTVDSTLFAQIRSRPALPLAKERGFVLFERIHRRPGGARAVASP